MGLSSYWTLNFVECNVDSTSYLPFQCSFIISVSRNLSSIQNLNNASTALLSTDSMEVARATLQRTRECYMATLFLRNVPYSSTCPASQFLWATPLHLFGVISFVCSLLKGGERVLYSFPFHCPNQERLKRIYFYRRKWEQKGCVFSIN